MPLETARAWHRPLSDILIAAALFAGSAVWATHFWNTWTGRGGRPEFYQIYFEPAVMIACGKARARHWTSSG